MNQPICESADAQMSVVATQRLSTDENMKVVVRRMRVPGGWLLVITCFLAGSEEATVGLATTFVADELGIWLNATQV